MMNPLNKWILSAAALILPLQVVAQSITVGSDSGTGGDALVIPVTFEAGADIAGINIDITFDPSQFSSASASCASNTACVGALATCNVNPAGTANFILAAGSACSSGQLGTISLTIDNAATAGPKPLNVTFIELSDSSGTDLDPNILGVTNGQVTVLGPEYTSAPPPGALNVGSVVQNDTDISAIVAISNTGAPGTTLTGTCAETSDPSGVFSVSNGAFSVLQGAAAHNVTVACDSAGAIATHTGTMECTHNGGNIASPAVYNLSCTITAGPQPAYSSNPAPGSVIDLGPTEQGDPDPSAIVSITNSGDSGTTLTGTCGVSGDAQISVVDGAFSVLQGGAADIQTVSCDASSQGSFSTTVSCDHNGSNLPNPATYTVNCEITPPGEAVFASNPAPGAIDMTPGDDPAAGSANPTSLLTFFNNADPGDTNLGIACSLAGDAEITVAPDISSGITIAPDASSPVTFTCDATSVGNYAATYTCPYDTDGVEGTDGSAQYNVTCDIREAESDVDPSPASGTPLTGLADPGGSFPFNVVFTEVNDEGIDGEVSCSLADGTNFAITSPLSFPAAVPAGGSLTVTVTGTAPDDGSTSVSDTLNCTYFDSDSGEVGTAVSYPLTLQIGGGVVFEVTKAYTDGYDGEVTVHLTCDTGLPLKQQFDISPDLPVFFVVTEFESGAMDCWVTEGSASGFEASYVASGDSASVDDDPENPGCRFFDVASGDRNVCDITNSPAPVDVVIEKDWIIAGAVTEEVADYFSLTLYCDGEIVGGSPTYPSGYSAAQAIVIPDQWSKSFSGNGNSVFTALVVPNFPTTDCWVEENVSGSSAVEVDNGCTDIEVSLNNGDSCVITNTVFFEGIPTLSQWGMAIMALLMLGVGLVGFRRFV